MTFLHIREGCGDVVGGRCNSEELESVSHFVWACQHLVAAEQVPCLMRSSTL